MRDHVSHFLHFKHYSGSNMYDCKEKASISNESYVYRQHSNKGVSFALWLNEEEYK